MQYFKNLKATGIAFALVMFAISTQTAMAVGTASNTSIQNTAAVDYQVAGFVQTTVTSNNTTFLVDNRVDLTVAGVGGTNVLPSSTDQPLTFSVTNTGNTSQGYALVATNGAGNFNMTNVRIYIEDGTTPGFQIGQDTLYVAAANAFDLAADATSLNVYVVADTPITPTNGQIADIDLLATTLDTGTTTVTVATVGADTVGVDVVFGDAAGPVDVVRDGQHSAVNTYTVAVTPLTLVKSSVIVSDPFNGTSFPKAIPGATIRYSVVVSNPAGAPAAATTVVIVDAMPVNTTYTAATITFNAAGRTDAVDGDNADFAGTNANAVTVTIPSLAAGASATITFDVTID